MNEHVDGDDGWSTYIKWVTVLSLNVGSPSKNDLATSYDTSWPLFISMALNTLGKVPCTPSDTMIVKMGWTYLPHGGDAFVFGDFVEAIDGVFVVTALIWWQLAVCLHPHLTIINTTSYRHQLGIIITSAWLMHILGRRQQECPQGNRQHHRPCWSLSSAKWGFPTPCLGSTAYQLLNRAYGGRQGIPYRASIWFFKE